MGPGSIIRTSEVGDLSEFPEPVLADDFYGNRAADCASITQLATESWAPTVGFTCCC